MKREAVPGIVSRAMSHRPVRWAPRDLLTGDYDGRERTLEIFNADAREQRALLAAIRDLRATLFAATGGPIVFIFHTRRESQRLYESFVRSFPRPLAFDPKPIVRGACVDWPVEPDGPGPHRHAA